MTDKIDPVIRFAFECGDLTEKAVTMVAKFAEKWDITGFDALLECRVISEGRIVDIISRRGDVERHHFDPAKLALPEAVLKKVPFADARRLHVVPVAFDEKVDVLTCVMANPIDEQAKSELAKIAGCKIDPLIAEKSRIDYLLGDIYPTELQIPLKSEVTSDHASTAS